MDGFLRGRALPTWDRQSITALIARLKAHERERGFLEGFVAAPNEKALAKATSGYLYRAWAFKQIDQARNAALTGCQKEKPKEQCVVMMENDHWVVDDH